MPFHLRTYLEKGEGKTIEFKETLPSKNQIAKTVVAFSNTAGGKIILGIEDKSKAVKGISEDQIHAWTDIIGNVIYDQCYPNIIPEISMIPFEEKNSYDLKKLDRKNLWKLVIKIFIMKKDLGVYNYEYTKTVFTFIFI